MKAYIVIDLSRCKEENKEKIEMLVLKAIIRHNIKSKYPAWIVR